MKNLSQVKFCLLGNIIIAASFVHAQERPPMGEVLPGLRDRAVVINIIACVVEQDQEIAWDSEISRVTIPGQPVGIRLVGPNIVITVQFTPYFRPEGPNVLVAQGQIFISIPGRGVSYHTIMEAVPLEFDEEIFFFPLGSTGSHNDASIEIQVVVLPYFTED